MTRRILNFRESLDRFLDYTPAGDLPAWPDSLFTTSPGRRNLLPPTRDEEHCAPSPWMTTGLGAVVPGDQD